MGPVSAKTSIDTPREEVFPILMDLSARPAFMSSLFEEFNLTRENPVGVGAGARFKLREAGWIDSVIQEAEPPHRLLERGTGGYLNRVPNVIEWLLMDTPGARGCEVQVTLWSEPSRILDRARDVGVSERKLARGLRRSLEDLRRIAEGGAQPERVTVAGGDRLGL